MVYKILQCRLMKGFNFKIASTHCLQLSSNENLLDFEVWNWCTMELAL
jgi:hypothetical protein